DHQTDRDFEVIIADDGSGAATREFLAWRAARLDRPLKHVWHEDRGFRAAEIRNRGILASSGDYCVFLDGDCIPRPNFIAVHRRLAEPGWFVTGNRVLLGRDLTERVLAQSLEPERWSLGTWLASRERPILSAGQPAPARRGDGERSRACARRSVVPARRCADCGRESRRRLRQWLQARSPRGSLATASCGWPMVLRSGSWCRCRGRPRRPASWS